jgi:SpoVK/Ycf46/Vps4 family AAA+-type ATPase
VVEAAEAAKVAAAMHGRDIPEPKDLDAGAREASSSLLGELASRLPPAYRWEDLVVPERQLELLQSISAYLRHRDRVLSEWGYDKRVARTQGLKVLFAGESGTGKTMSAQVLAAELGLEIFRVDLATIVSKYIGETEKNLDRIFAAADGSNAILFFDEADALFGKRSEVKDAHDRYANIEVAYLLQKMEQYEGLAVLASNLRSNIDEAFVRRLAFIVHFPFPEEAERRRIWGTIWPAATPLGADVDLDFLAAQFRLSGGNIKNVALSAAFHAAACGDERVRMEHIFQATRREYQKLGKVLSDAELYGAFAPAGAGAGHARGDVRGL